MSKIDPFMDAFPEAVLNSNTLNTTLINPSIIQQSLQQVYISANIKKQDNTKSDYTGQEEMDIQEPLMFSPQPQSTSTKHTAIFSASTDQRMRRTGMTSSGKTSLR